MGNAQARVDVATCARGFVSRVARELAADARRADDLRARAAEAATWLRERGASAVWLFGSLAWGDPHAESDVDVLVEGLSASAWPAAVREVERRLRGAHVDIVRAEEADASLVDRVRRHGVRLA